MNNQKIEKTMEDVWDNLGYKIGIKKKKTKFMTVNYSIKAFAYDDWLKIIEILKGENKK